MGSVLVLVHDSEPLSAGFSAPLLPCNELELFESLTIAFGRVGHVMCLQVVSNKLTDDL